MKRLNIESLKTRLSMLTIALLALILSFVELTEQILLCESVIGLDHRVLYQISHIQSTWLTPAMIGLTNLGGGFFIWPLSALLIFYAIRKRKKYEAEFISVVMVGGWLINLVLKHAIQRPRPVPPSGTALVSALGWSYPSGHALLSILFYLTLAYLLSERSESRFISALAYGIALCFSILIAFSRVYLQVHYLSDIIAGLIAGLLWYAVCMAFRSHEKIK